MFFYVTWAGAVVVMIAGILSMVFVRVRPRWAARMGAVMATAGLVVLANEALRPEPTAYIGVWALVATVTLLNWRTCQQAERAWRRRVSESLELLAELHQAQQQQRARTRPPKEC